MNKNHIIWSNKFNIEVEKKTKSGLQITLYKNNPYIYLYDTKSNKGLYLDQDDLNMIVQLNTIKMENEQ